MDPAHITDLIHLAKATSLSGAGCAALLGFFRLVRELRQPRALAKAVKSLDTQQEQQTLVELFRIARQPKALRQNKRNSRRRK